MPRTKNLAKTAQKCSKGNTKPLSTKPRGDPDDSRSTTKQKFRAFCFTSYAEEPPNFCAETMKYLCYEHEICPKTLKEQGIVRKHWQSYVYLYHGKTWSAFQKYIAPHNFKICDGTPEQNRTYCSKDNNGTFREFGTLPEQGKRTDLQDTINQIFARTISVDDILRTNAMHYHQYGRTLMKAEDLALRETTKTVMTQGYWYYGPTGAGKSYIAFEGFNIKTHYVVPDDNGWWDGYTQQPTVILNEFRGEMPYRKLLDLVDEYHVTVNRRNREPIPFTSEKLIITSSLPPSEVFYNLSARDSLEQLYRRFKIFEVRDRVALEIIH